MKSDVAEAKARALAYEDDWDPCLRGRIATEVYRTPGLHRRLARAEIVARYLEEVPVVIHPGEPIVGESVRRRRSPGDINVEHRWRNNAAFPEETGVGNLDEWPVEEPVKREFDWWKTSGAGHRRPRGKEVVETPRLLDALKRAHVMWCSGWFAGHRLVDLGIPVNLGLDAMRQAVARACQGAQGERKVQFAAMDRVLEGMSNHFNRWADEAERCEASADSSEDRKRLETIASDCRWLAHQPAATFRQALQMIYVAHVAGMLEGVGEAESYGRLDQILMPFYEADLAAGSLTRESALKLVQHFLIKGWRTSDSENITIGGLAPDGKDGTNEITRMFLQAMLDCDLVRDITVRIHKDTGDDLLDLALEALQRGYGRPSLYNDDVIVPALIESGIAPEDARDYAIIGCAEVCIPGRAAPRTMCMPFNIAKVLELTLTGGRCLVRHEQVIPKRANDFSTFGALCDAFHSLTCETIALGCEDIRRKETAEHETHPRPVYSCFSHGTLESGLDATEGGLRDDFAGVNLLGVADVVDSLLALRKLVYQDKTFSLGEMLSVLEKDWEGAEPMRVRIQTRFPRYGTDDEEANKFTAEETEFYASCFENERTAYGGRFMPMIFTIVPTGINFGRCTGALPSGRKSGTRLANSLTPSAEGRRAPLSAFLNSASAVNGHLFGGGISNVVDADPQLASGRGGLVRLRALARGFFARGGVELSCNVMDEEALRSAMERPQDHMNLMVKVYGLSVRFVALSRELQEHVLERCIRAKEAERPAVRARR